MIRSLHFPRYARSITTDLFYFLGSDTRLACPTIIALLFIDEWNVCSTYNKSMYTPFFNDNNISTNFQFDWWPVVPPHFLYIQSEMVTSPSVHSKSPP